jgi:hypothetical protein
MAFTKKYLSLDGLPELVGYSVIKEKLPASVGSNHSCQDSMMLVEEKQSSSNINALNRDEFFHLRRFLTDQEAATLRQSSYRNNQKLTSTADLAAFRANHPLSFDELPPFQAEQQQLNIYIVLQKLERSSENWPNLFKQFIKGTLNENMKNRLVDICKEDPAMAYRVMHTPLLLAALPAKEKHHPNLFSKILGGLIGFSAALLKPLAHLRIIFVNIFGIALTLLLLPLALPLLIKNRTPDNDLYLIEIAKFLISPILLLVSMADAIYQGYTLGAINALDNYDRLLAYGVGSRVQTLDPSHDVIYPPNDSNRGYFKPIYCTVADIAEDYQPPKPREAASNAPIPGTCVALKSPEQSPQKYTNYFSSFFSRNANNDEALRQPPLQPDETNSNPVERLAKVDRDLKPNHLP